MGNGSRKAVVFKDNTIARENLPFPIVLYPGHYGAFIGFKKKQKSRQVFLCSCAKEAIANFIRLWLRFYTPHYCGSDVVFVLNSRQFPELLAKGLKQTSIPSPGDIHKLIRFKSKLCHECNKAVPRLRYCVEMYGGAFKQNHGWYICKQAYEWGIDPVYFGVIRELCPQEVLDLMELDPQETREEYSRLSTNDFEKANELDKKLQKQNRKVWNVIENEVRRKFGHKEIGEAWTSETILYYIVESLFPDKTILRHYRPEFLGGLELDIFIKELNVGLEYQGIQHFKPIKHWGGKEALKKLRGRDKRKQKICAKSGVKLAYFNYDEELSDRIVLDKIQGGSKLFC